MAYFVKTPISIAAWDAGPEIEVNAIVGFEVHPARSQTQFEPAEPASVKVTTFRLTTQFGNELACPAWLEIRFTENEEFLDWLLSEAMEKDEAAKDAMAELCSEERRLGLDATRRDGPVLREVSDV
jgi:hypothetical protein